MKSDSTSNKTGKAIALALAGIVVFAMGQGSIDRSGGETRTIVKEVPVEVVKEVPVEVVREVEVPVEVVKEVKVRDSGKCDAVLTYAEKIRKATGRLSKITGTHSSVLSEAHKAVVMRDLKEIVIQSRRQTELLRDSAGPIRDIVENEAKLADAIKTCKEG